MPDQTITSIGGTALDLTEDEVRGALTGIADSPDTDSFLTSTLALLVTGNDDIFTASDCEGLTCDAGGFRTVAISDLNLEGNEYQAVMTYGGISFAQSRALGDPLPLIGEAGTTTEVLNYGGWLEHHFFGVQATFEMNTEDPTRVAVFSYTAGDATGSNPDDSGSGTWNGVAIGVNLLERFEDRSLLTADVTISIADFMSPTVDVLFDSIKDLRTGNPLTVSGLTVESVNWAGLDLTDGSFGEELGDVNDPLNFSQPRKRIEGRFYGPGHEEVGGIFEYASVAGSFGAARDDE